MAGLLIVGGGLAAARVVEGYREEGGEDEIVLLSLDEAPAYNRPPLSKGFLRGELEREQVLVHPPAWYEEQRAELRLGVEARRLDPQARAVELSGGERVGYERLVIASGALPRLPGMPGAELEGVHVYRTLADATAVRDAAGEAGAALVVGGSFIGLETSASLRRRGLEVTLVVRDELLFPALGSPELSRQLVELYRGEGVEVRTGETVAELTGDGRLAGARLASGRIVAVPLAIVGIGVEPATGWLAGSGLELDDGVVVDERWRSSLAGVYAVGDVARFLDPVAGRRRRIEHWSNASYAGKQLGRALAGAEAGYDRVAVFFTELFGRKLQVLGDVEGGFDELDLRGSLGEGRLLGAYLGAGALVGAVVAGHDPEVGQALEQLLRERAEPGNLAALGERDARVAAALGR
jgi:3-phenylpropionate/trans-cinnamate dioxygenase ferredoxin reductase subunit